MPRKHPRRNDRPHDRPGQHAPARALVPKVQAMLIAEFIHQDPATGLFTLHRVFNEVQARQFPAAQGPFSVFLQLTDGHGPTLLTLRLIDADEARPPLLEAALPMVFPDPIGIHNVRYQHSGLRFEAPGMYRLQLWAHGQCLSECRLLVRLS